MENFAMNAIVMSSPNVLLSTRQPWNRMEGESAKAFAAFCQFTELGSERSYTKVAEKLKKSTTIIGRWGKRFNWHHRAADFDEHNAREMQRALFARRARARKRALDL